MNYEESLEYLYNRLPVFHRIGAAAYKPGLDNTIKLLNAIENPQQKYKTIHIAGTNGKGSVSHFIAAILQSAGYKVGLYTSPHLVDFGERIRVGGEKIDKQYVVDFVSNRNELFETIQPSFFEATMAMAFQYFADKNVDVAVIEVGLGGRLDSTNIIQPELSVITNISYDHVGFLGDTLEKIAYEKAGIIKNNTPVVIGESLPETKPVFLSKAVSENAPIIFASEKFKIQFASYSGNHMYVMINDDECIEVGLCGNYQLKNIATVLASVKELRNVGFDISVENLKNGLRNVVALTNLKGRWQILGQQPLIVADTGHNVGGMTEVIQQIKAQKYRELHIVIGMVNDKDVSSVLALLPVDAIYYFTQADIVRALPAIDLEVLAQKFNLNGSVHSTVKEAVEAAIKSASTDDFIFIGGSNFIVGEALADFQ